MKCAAILTVLVCSLLGPALRAQDSAASTPAPVARPSPGSAAGLTMVVIPFENTSPTPGLEWVGESFPETFHQQLNSPVLYVASREERLRAYDRQGFPAGVHPSRATLYRLAEEMDVDYAVLGSYKYDGVELTAGAQLLDMRAQQLSRTFVESRPLADLGTLQSALAWDLLRAIRSDFSVPKERYVAGIAGVRLDAMENYIRGMLAASAEEKVQRYREAVRLNPDYAQAWLELGKTYCGEHDYEPAIAALSQVQSSMMGGEIAREANFYLGLAAYARGDFARAESAFEFVAARVPLAEVYNNLGVVAARRGQKKSAEYFEKAIQNDPADPDYHFNLAVALIQAGDRSEAVRHIRAALDRSPNDAEAKQLFDSLTPPGGSVVLSNTAAKAELERIKTNYDEDAFRQMTTQMEGWAEERFAKSDPRDHAHFHIELGKELLAHGFTAEAEAQFQHAAAVDPLSPEPFTTLAEGLEARGEAREARIQAEAALRIRESAGAYLILARLDLRENKLESAERNLDRALQLDPGSSVGQDLKRTLAAMLAEKAQPVAQP